MATDVLIPKLGMTMEEGTVAQWLVPDGAEVNMGDVLYRLETEKIEMEIEAEGAGTVRRAGASIGVSHSTVLRRITALHPHHTA